VTPDVTSVGEALAGIGEADALLGRSFPLPSASVPLARWVEVRTAGAGAAEVEWNLDDTRAGAPGRLALYAGARPPADQLPPGTPATDALVSGTPVLVRGVPLDEAQASLRPVQELSWSAGGLHLRLTAQGPWSLDDLLALAASIAV
jgi:hypothetical protein